MVSLQKKASFFLAITNPSLFLTTRRIAKCSSSCCAMRDIASTFGLCFFFFFFFQLMRIIIIVCLSVCLSVSQVDDSIVAKTNQRVFFFFEVRNGNRNDTVRFFLQKNRSSSGNFCGRSNSERLLRCTDLMYQSFVQRRRRDETRREEGKPAFFAPWA